MRTEKKEYTEKAEDRLRISPSFFHEEKENQQVVINDVGNQIQHAMNNNAEKKKTKKGNFA